MLIYQRVAIGPRTRRLRYPDLNIFERHLPFLQELHVHYHPRPPRQADVKTDGLIWCACLALGNLIPKLLANLGLRTPSIIGLIIID